MDPDGGFPSHLDLGNFGSSGILSFSSPAVITFSTKRPSEEPQVDVLTPPRSLLIMESNFGKWWTQQIKPTSTHTFGDQTIQRGPRYNLLMCRTPQHSNPKARQIFEELVSTIP